LSSYDSPELWPVELDLPTRHTPQSVREVVGDADVGRVRLEVLDGDVNGEVRAQEEPEEKRVRHRASCDR
jgi:hypothetical protein